jgi:hypothetical protein
MTTTPLKLIFKSLLILCLCTSYGCMSAKVVEQAKGGERWNREEKQMETRPAKPGYYLLLPLTFPADIATAPVVVPYLIWIANCP